MALSSCSSVPDILAAWKYPVFKTLTYIGNCCQFLRRNGSQAVHKYSFKVLEPAEKLLVIVLVDSVGSVLGNECREVLAVVDKSADIFAACDVSAVLLAVMSSTLTLNGKGLYLIHKTENFQ